MKTRNFKIKLTEDTFLIFLCSFDAVGEYDKALELEERVLALRRANMGEDHPQTLASMAKLAERLEESKRQEAKKKPKKKVL
jgi:hypothetical protein